MIAKAGLVMKYLELMAAMTPAMTDIEGRHAPRCHGVWWTSSISCRPSMGD